MSSTWIYTTRWSVSVSFTEYVYYNLIWKDVLKIYKEFDGPDDSRNVTYYLNVSDVFQIKYNTELEVFRTSIRKWT